MNNNKIIIAATTFFILASFIILSIIEKKKADINATNTWMVYFENPKDNSLNFTIENHSDNTDFHWTILADRENVKEGNISIGKGSIRNIPLVFDGTQDKKVTISVTANNETREIYKTL